ncbi:competence protein CoiA [Agrilactobacillus fermenti]|uniref:competence protein CoiA n=1 Tax=Agrilactobacillus fermenti TaxID=2586909 RepID=UPI001E3ABD78|nr:competence protein CoiA family protein [Agrilactobacillus fermenti]MCD2255459.1 hypothetical protein [Agrilactobacillus fermenti]
MNYALTEQNELVYLMDQRQFLELSRIQQRYYCPECGGQLRLKKATKQTRPHFVHINQTSHQRGESAIHIQGKQVLSTALDCLHIPNMLEVRTETKTRRADIYLTYQQQQIALEWQCALIGQQEILARSQSYTNQQIKVHWILGPNYRLKNRLRQIHLAMLRYRPDWGFYLLYLEPKNQALQLIHHIRQFDLRRQIIYEKTQWPLQIGLLYLLGRPQKKLSACKQTTIHDPLSFEQKRRYIQRQLYQGNQEIHQLQLQAYRQGHRIDAIPFVCFEAQPLPPLTTKRLALLNFELLLLLEQQPHQTLTALQAFINSRLGDYWINREFKAYWPRKVLAQFLRRLQVQGNLKIKHDQIQFFSWPIEVKI